jgi:hypothetical protein
VSRKLLSSLILISAFSSWPTFASPASLGECDAASVANPHRLTAIGRLPAVRMVVFDPVSNSFAFVEPCRPLQATASANQQYLDRRRLALTIQKIRLLILPYNPADGALTLDVSTGEGTESEIMPGAPAATTAKPQTTADSKPGEAKKPDTTPPKAPPIEEKLPSNRETINKKLTDRGVSVSPETVLPGDLRRQQLEVLAFLDDWLEAFGKEADQVNRDLRQFQESANCVHEHIRAVPLEVSRQLSIVRDKPLFTLSRDTTLAEVEEEAERRLAVLQGDLYKICLDSPDSKIPPLERDAIQLEGRLNKIASDIDGLGRRANALSRNAQLLDPNSPPKGVSADYWKILSSTYQKQIADLQSFVRELQAEQRDLRRQIDGVRGSLDDFRKVMGSPAFQLQRRNYPPLSDGESITFKFERSQVLTEDGKTTVVPAQTGVLELRSAPVAAVRFGTGVVTTSLRSPSFKPGPEVDETIDGNTVKVKSILFDDRNDGQVLPGLFIHHYWGLRSPLLSPTLFERFMPTFSLGIPLAKADLLQQVLFGLDWEIVPGLDINLGVHWGKVNALVRGYHVGDPPTLPSTVDITTLQEKRFRSAFYAGIVLNSDSYKSLVGGQQ